MHRQLLVSSTNQQSRDWFFQKSCFGVMRTKTRAIRGLKEAGDIYQSSNCFELVCRTIAKILTQEETLLVEGQKSTYCSKEWKNL